VPRERSGGAPLEGAEERWREFCGRLDELDAHVRELREMTADLLELGHGITLALRELATRGVPGGTLVGLLNRLVSEFVTSAQRRKGS